VDDVDPLFLAEVRDGPNRGEAVLPRLQRDHRPFDGQWSRIRAKRAHTALDQVGGHPLDDVLHDERRTAEAQMIDHMEDADSHFTFAYNCR